MENKQNQIDLKMDMNKISTDTLKPDEIENAKACYETLIKLQKFSYVTAVLWSITIIGAFVILPIIIVRIIMLKAKISLIQEHGYKEIKGMATFFTGWTIASLVLFTGFIPLVLFVRIWSSSSNLTKA